MRLLLVVAALAGCDSVFGLDPPADAPTDTAVDDAVAGRFCERTEHADAFCADFDDPSASDPLAAFVKADLGRGDYGVDEVRPHSAPRAAELGIHGTGSLDARLQRSLPTGGTLEVAFWMYITESTANQQIKVLSVTWGPTPDSIADGALYVVNDGRVVQRKPDNTYQLVGQVNALPQQRWTHVTLALDLVTSLGTLTIDDDPAADLELSPIDEPASGRRVILVGPHDPDPFAAVAWTVLVDDVVAR